MIGLDVGSRRIGIAVSEGRVAVPFTIIDHESRDADIRRIVEIAREQDATAIVVGLPLTISGEERGQAKRTRAFGVALADVAPVPVLYQDERLSTAQVAGAAGRSDRARNPASVHPARRRKVRVDDLAAAVILQSYLDAHPERT